MTAIEQHCLATIVRPLSRLLHAEGAAKECNRPVEVIHRQHEAKFSCCHDVCVGTSLRNSSTTIKALGA
jgi:hypothetical protein